jgi:ubiquinone/menaquinone biosynthesis C-methylase UbiE
MSSNVDTADKPAIGISHRDCCRVCGASALTRFLHLPQMPFTDEFPPTADAGQEFLADINVYVCERCWTAQTRHDVDVASYYEDYQYSVGGSSAAARFMRILAENLQARYFPGVTGRKVLEVGSGDGGQLLAFKEIGCEVLGYEPSSGLCKAARASGLDTVQGLFTESSARLLPADFQKVDVIALSYTFDHLPDPRAFLRACGGILDQRHGLLVVEVHDFEKIVERREYCLFEHEHSVYLTEAAAQYLCGLEGFEIVDFDLVAQEKRRANSLIFVATPQGSDHAFKRTAPRTPKAYFDLSHYERIGADVRKGIENLDAFVQGVIDSGKRVCGYGAGGRGVMTLAAMRNASKLQYLVDKQPKGQGLLVPKSRIPLVGLPQLAAEPVDEVIVFSFGYMKEIKAELLALGYQPGQLHSLLDLLGGQR